VGLTPEGPVAAVHIADIGAGAALKLLRKRPDRHTIAGCRSIDIGAGARFGRTPPRTDVGRVGLISFWDSDDALSEFHESHPLAEALGGGWHVRLKALRAHGSWPGLDEDVDRRRHTDQPGPYVVLTLARFKWPRVVAFARTSGPAEKAVVESDVTWVTAIVRPPFAATCSIWESEEAINEYAYRHKDGPHPGAITAGRKKPFHHRAAFVRFHPYLSEGGLAGKNPLPAHTLES
jgi:heme-degrading monooxygenase HmoA